MEQFMFSFVAYIDESGDDGLTNFRVAGRRGGSSHWLNVSSTVMRYGNALEAVKWRDSIAALRPQAKSRSIHFTDFNHTQRVAACQIYAGLPIRLLNVISNKRTIPAETYDKPNQLYFYLARYLIERISWLCRDLRPIVPEGNGLVKIIFSRRGGMSVENFQHYLLRLRGEQDAEVKIHWPVVDVDSIQALDHSVNAGLQLSDVGASAIAAGFEPDLFGNCESRYATIVRPVVYSRAGNYLSYGLKLVPSLAHMDLTPQQEETIAMFS